MTQFLRAARRRISTPSGGRIARPAARRGLSLGNCWQPGAATYGLSLSAPQPENATWRYGMYLLGLCDDTARGWYRGANDLDDYERGRSPSFY